MKILGAVLELPAKQQGILIVTLYSYLSILVGKISTCICVFSFIYLLNQALNQYRSVALLKIQIINNCFQKKPRTATLSGYTENTVKIKTQTVHSCA